MDMRAVYIEQLSYDTSLVNHLSRAQHSIFVDGSVSDTRIHPMKQGLSARTNDLPQVSYSRLREISLIKVARHLFGIRVAPHRANLV